jgi:hypothetical protein
MKTIYPMKKLLISILFLATISCGRNSVLDPVNSNQCEKALENYQTALTSWSTDANNKTKCEAYKKALNDVIKGCSVYTAAQRKLYEDQLKQLTCD